MGKGEEWLRQGFGDDVSRWKGITVRRGMVIKVEWPYYHIGGRVSSQFGMLTGLEVGAREAVTALLHHF